MRKSPLRWAPRSLSGLAVTDELLERCAEARDGGQQLVVDMSRVSRIYPNGAVPFATAVDFLSKRSRVSIVRATKEVQRTCVLSPVDVGTELSGSVTATDTVWRYTEDQAGALCNLFIDVLTHTVPCEPGVLDAINWCLFEVMDNVFQHGRSVDHGFAMLQVLRQQRRIVFAVGDSGIGVHRSFAIRGVYVASAADALERSLVEGGTSTGDRHRGNGLFGLSRVAELNGGRLAMRSGKGELICERGTTTSTLHREVAHMDREWHSGTFVDWQVDAANAVSLAEALGRRDPETPLIERIEDDEGAYVLPMANYASDLGSRHRAANVRTHIQNLLKSGAVPLRLDFSGASVVSSSFADEVVGKLAEDLGVAAFERSISFGHVSEAARVVLTTAIAKRTQSLPTAMRGAGT